MSLSRCEEVVATFNELLYFYGHLYGPQVLLLALLSAITVYRREISCNHCYAEVEEGGTVEAVRSSIVSSESWDAEETDCLLEGAGCPTSLAFPLLSRLLQTWRRLHPLHFFLGRSVPAKSEQPPASIIIPTTNSDHAVFSASEDDTNPLSSQLPPDAVVNVLSYLHPKDVVSYACVNKSARKIVEGPGELACTLWRDLWHRDYSWLVESWDVGRRAAQRSGLAPQHCKDFYFRFGLSYLNYVLAGQNTLDRCLVGLGGHIYDLTEFLDSHPGSPETVLVHAGRDATVFFESLRHTMGARRLAQSYCIVVDTSLVSDRGEARGCGIRPTLRLVADDAMSYSALPSAAEPVLPHGCPRRTTESRVTGTLERLRGDFRTEEDLIRRRAAQRFADEAVLGEINTFFDPFCRKWKVWYTSTNLETVYAEDF
jgi:hypothetical protein